MNLKEFAKYVRKEVRKSGGRCHLPTSKRYITFPNGSHVNGYWDCDDMLLCAALGQSEDQAFALLVHEFCHFIQWRTKRTPYMVLYDKNHPICKATGLSIEEVFFNWVDGGSDDVEKDLVIQAGKICRDMELDCERLSYNLIKTLDLPIDRERYAQKAAAYVYFYNVILETRKWYKIGQEPYNTPAILDKMPCNLKRKFDKTPKSISKLMQAHCL